MEKIPQHLLAEFFVQVASGSNRPKAILSSTSAALNMFFSAVNRIDVMDQDVRRLIDGLVKSGTTEPMRRTKVMPTQPFINMFRSWGENNDLSVWSLRLKAITLLALSVMLRPSDIAPKSKSVQEECLMGNQFKRSWLDFSVNGYLVLYLFGNKNDYKREGFRVCIPESSDKQVCPVKTLHEYVQRTQRQVDGDGPVFLSLQKPFNGLGAAGVASVLNKSIELAGLKGRGFSAKCFRPTGATMAVEAGLDPNLIREVGRWKSAETFETHYVHAKPPVQFTDAVLNLNG